MVSQLDIVLAEVNGNHHGAVLTTPVQKIEFLRSEAKAIVDEIRHREERLQFQGYQTPEWVCPGCENG